MTDEATQATAENLRADFLNTNSNYQRWKVLNRAIAWAVAASENAAHHREAAKRDKARQTINVRVSMDDERPILRQVVDGMVRGGSTRGLGVSTLVGEKCQGQERRIRAGDIVTWDGDEEGWIVEVVRCDGRAVILPLGEDYALARTVVTIEDVWPPAGVAGTAV